MIEKARFIAVLLLLLPQVAAARTHTVSSGESLWTIAKKYGCTTEQIKRRNNLGKFIRPGQKLRIPRCDKADKSSSAKVKSSKNKTQSKRKAKPRRRGGRHVYTVRRGDTLGKIARRYGRKIKDIKRWNGLRSNFIRVGQRIRIASPGYKHDGRPIIGQSVGTPSRGRLNQGRQMKTTDDWYIRRPRNAWGTNHMVYYLRSAMASTRLRYPDLHAMSVGDLSDEDGGRLYPHKSHQSGRDVDLGFYFDKTPPGYPKTFIRSNGTGDFHVEANWFFLRSLIETRHLEGGMQVVFLDYRLQKVLYQHAKDKGADDAFLNMVFQYPNGRGARRGLIRHEPGHANHYHVRFKCSGGASHCAR